MLDILYIFDTKKYRLLQEKDIQNILKTCLNPYTVCTPATPDSESCWIRENQTQTPYT